MDDHVLMHPQVRRLARYFNEDDWPNLTCPVCNSGALLPEEISAEHGGNAATRDSPDWLDYQGHFHGRLVCNRSRCGDWIVVTGDFGLDPNDDPAAEHSYVCVLRVRTMLPAVRIIDLPADLPPSIVEEVDKASALIWLDPPTAVTRLRTAAERLMDEQKILGKNLHRRLESFKKVQPEAAELLLATKYVGNEGTHQASTMTAKDALDIAEMIELALGTVYSPNTRALTDRAARIIAAGRLVP